MSDGEQGHFALHTNFARRELLRCPFVRLISQGRHTEAALLASEEPDPAEPIVVAWLISEARRHLERSEQ